MCSVFVGAVGDAASPPVQPSPPVPSVPAPQDLKPVIDGMDGIKISQGLGLQDFDLIRVIGRGSYAKVLLVRLKKNDQVYAMKVVKKELVHDDEVGAEGGSGGVTGATGGHRGGGGRGTTIHRVGLGSGLTSFVLLAGAGARGAMLTALKPVQQWCRARPWCRAACPLQSPDDPSPRSPAPNPGPRQPRLCCLSPRVCPLRWRPPPHTHTVTGCVALRVRLLPSVVFRAPPPWGSLGRALRSGRSLGAEQLWTRECRCLSESLL